MEFLHYTNYSVVIKLLNVNVKCVRSSILREIGWNCSRNPPKGILGKNPRNTRKSAVGGQISRCQNIQEQLCEYGDLQLSSTTGAWSLPATAASRRRMYGDGYFNNRSLAAACDSS